MGEGPLVIDRAKAAEDARFDGIFVLRTNTDLNPLAAMLRCCNCGRWSASSVPTSTFATRPIFHKLDRPFAATSLFVPALVLKIELEHRIAALGEIGSWPEILSDLDAPSDHDHPGRQALVVRPPPRPPPVSRAVCAGVACRPRSGSPRLSHLKVVPRQSRPRCRPDLDGEAA